MTITPLTELAELRRSGRASGIASICSAHPEVIAAALALGRETGRAVLIEATCNQVNQDGGYTGMTPVDFRRFVLAVAEREGFATGRLILGGDHLGPNPWTGLPAEAAMEKACAMVAAYVAAGFRKLHLDTSMSCAGDPVPLPEHEVARRAARLAAVAEAAGERPVYVIGTEVPVPGGALETVDHLAVTRVEAAEETVAIHRAAFAAAGIGAAFERVVGLVVQPGVEFGNENVVAYDPGKARGLSAALERLPMVYEAHSTDYQTPAALARLVADGFAILKVGPGLTFALREALYGLDQVAEVLFPGRGESLRDTMERVMLARPGYWERYYPGDPAHQRLQRHFSYSDRIRYYWTDPEARQAVARLMGRLDGVRVPEPLNSQFLGAAYPEVMAGAVEPSAPALVRAAVTRVLRVYDAACGPAGLA